MKQTHPVRRWGDVLRHRWPTVLGIGVAVLTAFDLQIDAGFVSSISAVVVLMALVYLGSAALDRRWSAWVVLLAGLPVAFFVSTISDAGAWAILLAASVVFVALGVARGQLRRPGGLALQAVGMLVFGAIALTTLFVDTVLGAYLVAAALLCHAVWDAFHYLRDRVVARSYAEFCGILDLVLGVTILLFLV